MRSVRATILLAVLAGPSIVFAQKTSELQGRIVTESGEPIRGATVMLTGLRFSVRTDSLGRFSLSGTPGSTLSLALKAEGYREEKADVVLSRGRPVVREFVLVTEQATAPIANPGQMLRIDVVTDDGSPLAYANIQVNGGRRYVTSDSGRLQVPVPTTGGIALIARRIGFEPTELRLPARPDTAVRLSMKEVAATLEAQTVTVRSPYIRLDLSGFYKRMDEVENGARVGYFVTPEDLALRKPQNVTDAVEQFPSIRLAPIDNGKIDAEGYAHADGTPTRMKFRIEDRKGCPMTVYLDRVRIQPSVSGMKWVDEEINSLIRPGSVAGIEVYPRAAGAPPEFPPANSAGLSECGVVLIWTK